MEREICPLLPTEDQCSMVDTIVGGGWLAATVGRGWLDCSTASLSSSTASVGCSSSSKKSLTSASVTQALLSMALQSYFAMVTIGGNVGCQSQAADWPRSKTSSLWTQHYRLTAHVGSCIVMHSHWSLPIGRTLLMHCNRAFISSVS
jgi:hypothetical protein